MELTPTTQVTADDGTRLAVHLSDRAAGAPAAAGDPLVCLPGGPMLDSAYLGDLGGLGALRTLARLDLRGTGASGTPADPVTYRCDRQVADVEALRRHLGLERMDLFGHSAGANLAYAYAAAHPDRVARLLLVAPSVRGLGIDIPDEARSEIAGLRAAEPWYADAAAALARVQAGAGEDADWAAIAPFTHGRWDDDVRAYDAWMDEQRDAELAMAFGADGAYDADATRAVLQRLDVPVLVLAGGHDTGNPPGAMGEVARLFPQGELVVQPGAGHFPWVDDPQRFVSLVEPFVRTS
jgi:proline iminopeptidase